MANKKKKVLIVSSYCFQKASANGICARSLYNEFVSRGYETHILGIGDDLTLCENEHAVLETPKKNRRLKRVEAAVKLIKSMFTQNQDTKKLNNYYKKIKELNDKYDFDLIVAMFFPLEIVRAVSKLKKKDNSFKFVIYELDSVADGISGNGQSFLKRLQMNSSIRWCKANYRLAEKICVLKGHTQHTDRIYSKEFGEKIEYVDLPLLEDKIIKSNTKGGQFVEFVYSGELNSTYRPPDKLLKTFELNNRFIDWNIHFFSKGDCENLLKKCQNSDNRIKSHGYVSQEVLHNQYDITDFFISIGNTHSNSVPSKIINYISFGKPIIHFCLQENDICEEYLNKYPLALVIKKGESPEDAAGRIIEFVKETRGKTVDFQLLKKTFPMNLPSYSADIILDFLDRKGKD